jgi:hypothetical protein
MGYGHGEIYELPRMPALKTLERAAVPAADFVLRSLLAPQSASTGTSAAVTRSSAVSLAPQAPPHMPCKIYYPNRAKLSAAQLDYYKYWRATYESGQALPADKTYRFLYAYELCVEAVSPTALERSWSELIKAYRDNDDGFAAYVASWVTDLRWITKRYVVDDILFLGLNGSEALDVALRAGVAPRWHDVVNAILWDKKYIDRIAAYLADNVSDLETVRALAAATGPVTIRASFFQGLPVRPRAGVLPASNRRPSYVANPRFQKPLAALVHGACEALGLEKQSEAVLAAPVVSRTGSRTRIDLPPLEPRAQPAADTLDGLFATIRHGIDDDARMLLLVVLAASEHRPYVEGRIDADKPLRDRFEAFGARCSRKVTLGNFRRGFFALGQGQRAVVIHEPPLSDQADVKMNHVVARFVKGLQHALYGTDARRAAIKELISILSRRCEVAEHVLVDAIADVCGTGPALLPRFKHEDVA